MTTAWAATGITAAPVRGIGAPPIITAADVTRILPTHDLWDFWPARTPDGSVAEVCGHSLWAALSAPAAGDPSLRHDHASIRLLQHGRDGSWRDLGPMFEKDTAEGTRQWAGSMVVEDGRISVFYTAAGAPDANEPSFRQRMFTAEAEISCDGRRPTFGSWTDHCELFAPDDRYDSADEVAGRPGFIKAFRDPFPYTDPESGHRYLFFTGSLAPAASTTDFNGVIGLARQESSTGRWVLLDPLVTADGVNNELERPHVVAHDGRLYLFFSTQARTFHPDVTGPTGLYGFVGDAVEGPYEPLNGHGVVFTNPPEEPLQAYSWLVLNDLTTTSFVDAYSLHGTGYLGGDGRDVATDRAHFGGTLAPAVRIGLAGDRAWLDDVDVPIP